MWEKIKNKKLDYNLTSWAWLARNFACSMKLVSYKTKIWTTS